MLFYKKHLILLAIFFSLSSCDFVPLHTSDPKRKLINNKIFVENIDTEIGFYLFQNLKFSLNDNGQEKRLKLLIDLSTSEKKYAFSSYNEETRIDLNGVIECTLSNGKNTHRFTLKETVSYDVSQSIIANKAAKRNANKRLANLLSQAVLTELYHSSLNWIK